VNKEFDKIAEGDHQKFIQHIRETEGEDAAIQMIHDNMEPIILHYIECTWGACYTTKFRELIQPYFNDSLLLDKILRSEAIKNKGNMIVGRTGAKIYKDLYWELLKCKDPSISNYLKDEFEDKINNM
jgi:hypothetical protein